MRIPLRAARRLAVTCGFALASLLLVGVQGRAATPPEKMLPDSTVAFVKINNAAALREAFLQSQFGQLWNDPAVKTWKDDTLAQVDDASKTLKEKIGVTYRELFELPQGPTAIAFLKQDNPQIPIVLLVIADAGKNTQKMTDVLTRATKQGEANGAKVSTDSARGVTIHVIQPPKEDPAAKEKAKDKDKDSKKIDLPEPPIVWASQGSVFYLGSDVAALKDLLAHEQGRNDALAASEWYGKAVKKLGSDAQVTWYVDIPQFLKLMLMAQPSNGAKGDNPNQAQQAEAMIQVTGLNGLKAAIGSFTLNAGNYDSLTKTIVLTQGPAQGILKAFRLPRISLRPEPWVPASVASYQTISWDLDQAYVALNDLANMFQPGVLQVFEQQLAGPNGQPLRFKQDIFDPLGDRITIVSDFKKPVTEESERMLLAVALEDSKKMQDTLNKLITLTGGQPKKREFQGTTIYDFEIPDMPNPNAGPGGGGGAGGGAGKAVGEELKARGPISVAIAKETLFLSSEQTLLEQMLRGGGPGLADSTSYQAVAKEMPGKVSSLTYVRPDEQARITYDMIKSGQFEKALQGAAVAGGPDLSRFAKLINKDKMPDFSVFAKYLSQGGRYSESGEEGVTITGFSLRKRKP